MRTSRSSRRRRRRPARTTGRWREALADAVAEIEGERPRFELCPGLLETRWYAQRGIPAYAYGPGALEVAHQADEHVEIPRLLRAVDIYTQTATTLLSAGEARGPPRRSDDRYSVR